MSVDREPGDDIRVRIDGSVEGQVAIGRNHRLSYVRSQNESSAVTEADLTELRRAVEDVKARILAEVDDYVGGP